MTHDEPRPGAGRRDPVLTTAQSERLKEYATASDLQEGSVLYSAGDYDYDLIFIESGAAEVYNEPAEGSEPEMVAGFGAGSFLGELNLLTHQAVYLNARTVAPSRVHRVSPPRLRELMAREAELSAVLLQAFLARREGLREGSGADGLHVIGSTYSGPSTEIRTFLARLQIPHRWTDVDDTSLAGAAVSALDPNVLPVVVMSGRTMTAVTPGELATILGVSYRAASGERFDVAIIGAGPAGLAAGVYCASEGLKTVLVDRIGPGGQAATSSRIENYLGFPEGISGIALARRASVQVQKFGAAIYSPCAVKSLDTSGPLLGVILDDGTRISAGVAVIAVGVRYRSLPIPDWDSYLGRGIFYASTELEAAAVAGLAVVVVGGANSAGQAALFLSSRACQVDLVIRAASIDEAMSSYLARRLEADPNVRIHTKTEVTALQGSDRLSEVTLTHDDTSEAVKTAGLFCFIGAVPATRWLVGVGLDDHGFILTTGDLGAARSSAGSRDPLPFETTMQNVFAIGDARRGSMKRVAAAAGEGASVVASIHSALGALPRAGTAVAFPVHTGSI